MTSTPPTDDGVAGGSKALLVLVVDDHGRNRKLVRDVLRAAEMRTLEAASGAECLELAAAYRPDVILLDLRLPDIAGVEVARRLSAEVRTATIPVVALSAGFDAGLAERLHAVGFAGYLEKPIDVAAFPKQVRGFCRS